MHVFNSSAAAFLDEISVDLDEDEFINNVYAIEIDNYHLEENNNDAYRVKLDLHRLVQEGKKLRSIIQRTDNDDYNVYKVVRSETDIISEKNFISGNINLYENNVTKDELVVLYYKERYYGPFKVCCRTYDNRFYISTRASENNYLVPFYSAKDVSVIELEKQAYYKDSTYTNFIQTAGANAEFEDVITDEILLEKISDDISLDLAVTKPDEFLRLFENSPFLAGLHHSTIIDRFNRLLNVINSVEKYKEKKHEVFKSLLKLYNDTPSEVSDKMIAESKRYKELQEKYTFERKQNEDAEKQIQELKKEMSMLNAQVNQMSQNSSDMVSSEENSKLRDENLHLKEELEKAKDIVTFSEDIVSLKKEQEKLKNNNDFLIGQAKDYKEQIKSARTAMSEVIKDGASKMTSLAFDPFISSRMMKEAAAWDSDKETEEYEKRNSALSAVAPSDLCDTELVDYIVNYVQKCRDYSRNDIINIYISLAQNFITIFSGEPGTGKTSMCSIAAETLGLMKYGKDINRFVSVSVERGWSSKRDLIGYYNPLTRKYDKSNRKIYDALRILDIEKEKSEYPFVIMLDEANLSPIEYYWADFMRLADRTSENDKYINIGADRELFVPETLRFVATINTDQTTEALSPRLIDRACIIKLPKAEIITVNDIDSPSEIITWKNFKDAFSKKSELNPVTRKAQKEIYKLFEDYGMSVSPRIQIGIEKYVMAAQEIMEDENEALAREKALDFAVVQKLLPKIDGYYSVYERFFDNMKKLCREYNLNMTEKAISKIVETQEHNMGYCHYLV